MSIRVRAPATTANIGPAFDCAAAALDLWNEVEISESAPPPDRDHLAVRAFERIAPLEGLGFSFTDRIPRERGLGSSAATIALGLVAGALVAGRDLDPEELLAIGVDLEGHPDNLAAALAGGVCLTWNGAIARIANDAPATPIALVPAERVGTRAAREALPSFISHADAAHNVARAAVLGASLATGSVTLFAAAADDRLHEPYRAGWAPLLGAVREHPPAGMIAATLSGSGPSVIVWAQRETAAACADELRLAFPDADVLTLSISTTGAGQV
ncbi:MAG: homoserine kinase [Gaiellaceae bacterium MAG52_C11]|nr:homoserine kinase [Candidatus Gaiellasilicea maunaloa]